MQVCPLCWSRINWCESFSTHGHADGDDCVHTNQVAAVLRKAGYWVIIEEGGLHNSIISEIGQEEIPGELNQFYFDNKPPGNIVGSTDPRTVLPAEVNALLDRVFGSGVAIC